MQLEVRRGANLMGKEEAGTGLFTCRITKSNEHWDQFWGFVYENNYELAHVCHDGWQSFVERKYQNKLYTCDKCGEKFRTLQIERGLAMFGGNIKILLPPSMKAAMVEGRYQ